MRAAARALILAVLSFMAQAAERPHIVIIVADDLGWNDVGFRNGQTIQTPAIDSLASTGHVLSNYYVQATCSPTRACFLTGRLPAHTGIGSPMKLKEAVGISLREVTVAQVLRKEGYRAHAVGKWHVGMLSFNHTPTFRGFESFYGFYGGSEDYYQHNPLDGVLDFRRDRCEFCGRGCSEVPVGDVGQYSTDLFTAEAVRLIASHDRAVPLFLYLAYQAVHGPIEAPARVKERYWGKFPNNPLREKFAAVVTAFDEGVGGVVAALQARGMYEDTLLVITTDNGGSSSHGASNRPLRAGKGSIWEGGLRGTAVVRGPGLRNDGSAFAGLAHAVDWLPTFARLAGGVASADVDGIDLWPRLATTMDAPGRDQIYLGVAGSGGKVTQGHRLRAIRNGALKLVVYTRPDDGDDPERKPSWSEKAARKRARRSGANLAAVGRRWAREAGLRRDGGWFLQQKSAAPEVLEVLLYDVEADPGEARDIAAERPAEVHGLLGMMAAVRVDEVPLDHEVEGCERAVHRVHVGAQKGGARIMVLEPACDLPDVPVPREGI